MPSSMKNDHACHIKTISKPLNLQNRVFRNDIVKGKYIYLGNLPSPTLKPTDLIFVLPLNELMLAINYQLVFAFKMHKTFSSLIISIKEMEINHKLQAHTHTYTRHQ